MLDKDNNRDKDGGSLGDPTIDEVLGIMVDGGKKLCDYAIEQWSSYKYSFHQPPTIEDEKMRQEYMMRWRKIKRMINKKEWQHKAGE